MPHIYYANAFEYIPGGATRVASAGRRENARETLRAKLSTVSSGCCSTWLRFAEWFGVRRPAEDVPPTAELAGQPR